MDIYILIAITLGLSATSALLFRRAGFSEIAGYLAIGIILSFTLSEKFVENKALLSFFTEIAITLLIFEVGREIGIKDIRRLSFLPAVILFSELVASFAIAVFVGTILKLKIYEIFALAIIGSFSSTPVIYKILEKLKVEEDVKKLLFTLVILEDIFASLILILIPNLKLDSFSFLNIIQFLFLSASFAILLLLLGFFLIKAFRNLKPDELGIAIAISIAFLFSALSRSFMFSPALGAFIAGLAFSSHPNNKEIGEKIKPIREFFLILFFTSLGLEAGLYLSFSPLVIIMPLLVVTTRFLSITFSTWVFSKRSLQDSIQIGLIGTSVGEFSLVILHEATNLGIVGKDFLLISAACVIFGTIVSSKLSFKSEYAAKLSSIVPIKIKLFVDNLSVNVLRVIEGKESEFVRQITSIIFRNVVIVVIVSIFGSASIYFFKSILPQLKYPLSMITLATIVAITFLIAKRTKAHAENLCCLLVEKRGLNPVLKKILSTTIFFFIMLTSINLILIVSGEFILHLVEEVFSLTFGHRFLALITILVFLLSSYFIYLQIRRFPF